MGKTKMDLIDDFKAYAVYPMKNHLSAYNNAKHTGMDLKHSVNELNQILLISGSRMGIEDYIENVVVRVNRIVYRVYKDVAGYRDATVGLMLTPEESIQRETLRYRELIDQGYRGLFDWYDREELIKSFPPIDHDITAEYYVSILVPKLFEVATSVDYVFIPPSHNLPEIDQVRYVNKGVAKVVEWVGGYGDPVPTDLQASAKILRDLYVACIYKQLLW